MIVLGIDPGLANTGYGVVALRGGRLAALDGGVIETRADSPQERRLADIHEEVDRLIATHEPDAVALEELYFGQNVRTAFAVGHARGVVMLAAGQRGLPCSGYTPSRSRARCAATAARPRIRSRAWCRRCCGSSTSRDRTTPPTRSPWRSATPTARR